MQKKLLWLLSAMVVGAGVLVIASRFVTADALAALHVNALRWIDALPKDIVLWMPLYVLFGCALLVVVLSSWRIAHSLDAIWALHKHACDVDRASHIERRRASLTAQLSQPQGWADAASQVVADALHQTVSLNVTDAGVMDVATLPAPRFTVCAVDGRQFTFTVNPGALQQQGLLHKSSEVVSLSTRGSFLSADAQMLWEVLHSASQSTPHTAVPRHMTWYLVVAPTHRMQFHQKPLLLESGMALPARVLRTLHLL
jgi:hypothetical protein